MRGHRKLLQPPGDRAAGLGLRRLARQDPEKALSLLDVYAGKLPFSAEEKVAIARGLMTRPKVLILDEPTRGIDVGAKYEIYCIINELAEAGKGVVVISSEMPELLGICDRICVMNDGAFVGEFAKDDATQEKIMRAIMRNVRMSGSGVHDDAVRVAGGAR